VTATALAVGMGLRDLCPFVTVFDPATTTGL